MRAVTQLVFVGLVFGMALPGCGGNADGNGSGSGGSGHGGASGGSSNGSGGANMSSGGAGNSGKGGSMNVGAGGFTGSGGVNSCCLAEAVCDDGDERLGPGQSCPPNAECYKRSVCCSTVYCARHQAQCDGIPSCDEGDTQLDGPCPPDTRCYTRSLCGTTIYCLDSSCDAEKDYNRRYVAKDQKSCALADFICQPNTTPFTNACGCGCEQDANCPEYVDCEPGSGDQSLLCSDLSKCPFTSRAL